MWQEVNRYKIVNDDGNSETMILERNVTTGSFRIKNEFGNVSIELDAMSAVEFLRRAFDDVQDLISDDLNYDWDEVDTDLDSDQSDCDGDTDG